MAVSGQDVLDTPRAGIESMPRPFAPRGKALVVDDARGNRFLLESLLSKEGFSVLLAEDGEQGVAVFEREGADIVFMDIMMPHMDGYEATRRIKALAGEQFVPVIFLTALNDEDALAKCIEVGGDDFLTKPYQPAILKAKIIAAERTRDLYRRIQTQHAELRVLHGRTQREQEIAEQLFTGAVAASNVPLDCIRTLLRPAAIFSGDFLLTARRPSGELNILLGDFTGHGLTAAVGALPTSEVFRAMTAKGFSAADILKEINHKLARLLPEGVFMAACFLTVDMELQSVAVWNGGMPDILVLSREGRLRERIPSSHFPLGISDDLGDSFDVEWISVVPAEQLLLYSDGLIEARDANGEMFGESRLEQLVQESGEKPVFESITEALDRFCRGCPQDDDITLVDIACDRALTTMQPTEPRQVPRPAGEARVGFWRWSLELQGHRLQDVDPIPLAMAQLQEIQDLSVHRETLYTVLFELFSNALDHGVLGLDSALKNSDEGFTRYYSERERRLAGLDEGRVRIELLHRPDARDGHLVIRFEDSGTGFDHQRVVGCARQGVPNTTGYSGRGIPLLLQLCDALRYDGVGNRVEAVYAW